MASSTKKEKILNSISPASLVSIVALNLFLIYLNLVSLENQNIILLEIKNNTEISLVNQELGLEASEANHQMLEHVLQLQGRLNQTIDDLNVHMHQTNETLMRLNLTSH